MEKECCKVTLRSDEDKKKLIHRLNRVEGQIRGIRKLIENDAYCNDVLMQSSAVNAAMNAFNRELLNYHLHHCVIDKIQNGDEEVVDELTELFAKLMK